MYQQFVVPTDEEYLEVLGEIPKPTGDVGVVTLTFEDPRVCAVLTIDVLGRAVSLRLREHGAEALFADIYREGAIQLRLSEEPQQVLVEFRSDGSEGKLRLAVGPPIVLEEQELLASSF